MIKLIIIYIYVKLYDFSNEKNKILKKYEKNNKYII